jgi:hypothetical protein
MRHLHRKWAEYGFRRGNRETGRVPNLYSGCDEAVFGRLAGVIYS